MSYKPQEFLSTCLGFGKMLLHSRVKVAILAVWNAEMDFFKVKFENYFPCKKVPNPICPNSE